MENIKNNRTDLAKEFCGEEYIVRCEGNKFGDNIFTVEEILRENGNRYITVSSSDLISSLSMRASIAFSKLLAGEIINIVGDVSGMTVILGIGNREMAVDSLGVRVAELISPVRAKDEGKGGLSVLIPGIEASTGISSFEIVSSVFSSLQPQCAIAVDSLAAVSADSLGRTVQISNAGISPGSGLGTRKYLIDRTTVGVPVLSIGVPTVISANRFIYNEVGETRRKEDFFVALSKSDAVVEASARIIATAIEEAFAYR